MIQMRPILTDLFLARVLSFNSLSLGYDDLQCCHSVGRHGQIILLLIHAIQALALRWSFKRSTLMLWLYQRHALKAFRASVGDVEGHKMDCILALRAGQVLKIHSLPTSPRKPVAHPASEL